MNVWNQVREKLFPPPESKWLAWLIVPAYFLATSAIVVLAQTNLADAIVLFMALGVLVVYAITGKKSLFLSGFFAFMATVTYLFWLDWNVPWLGTIFLSLYLGYEITGEVQNIFHVKEIAEKDLRRDAELWQSRFEILREKIEEDKVIWESEIEKRQQAFEDKSKEMDSLRVLIGISHKETRRAEEKIDELKQSIGNQQDALNYRQTINKSLQTKKSTKQPISLKDLLK